MFPLFGAYCTLVAVLDPLLRIKRLCLHHRLPGYPLHYHTHPKNRPEEALIKPHLRIILGWAGVEGVTLPKGSIYCPSKDSGCQTIPDIMFGTRVLIWAVYEPFGFEAYDYQKPSGLMHEPGTSPRLPALARRLGGDGHKTRDVDHCCR